jgi:flagellar motility protein MotE (MotC chaperone)
MRFTTKHAKLHLPATLLGFLIVKLVLDGTLLYMNMPVLPVPVLDSRPALAGNADSPVPSEPSLNSQNLGKKTKILEQKRAEVEAARRQLERERKQLMALKQKIEADLVKLAEIQDIVQRKLDEHKTIRSNKIKHLLKIYTTMAPKKAVALIEELDMELVMELFSQMKAEHVGQLLPHMSAEKAAKIGEHLAKKD